MKITSAEFVKGIRGTDPITSDGVAQVAFVGRSNVGKSSLINALTNRKKLVKVGDTPGKTREINFFMIEKRFYFVDLPGYGYAKVGPKEKEAIKKLILWYLMASEAKPNLVVVVLDAKVGVTIFDKQMIEILRTQGHPFLLAINKGDKLSQSELSKQVALVTAEAEGGDVVVCSATKADGTRKLLEKIERYVI